MKNLIVKVLLLLFLISASVAQAATLLPNGEQVFLDNNGVPVTSGTVTFYIPGTTVLKTTWQNAGQTVSNTNPVVLNSAGRAIIYGSGSYRQIVKDNLGNTIWDRVTADTSASSFSWASISSGSGNAQTVSASNFSSQDGQIIGFIAGFTNSTAMTISPNGVTPIAVVKDTGSGPVALTGGEVVAGNSVQVVYDVASGVFHIVAPILPTSPTFTTVTTASLTDSGPFLLTGIISPAALAANTNDWNPTGFSTATVIRASSSSDVNLTGLTARANGTIISIENVGSNRITLTAQDAASTAANRFQLSAGEVIGANQSILLQYDGTTAAWRLFQKITKHNPYTVRQTVESGPSDASGFPNFLPATSVSLTLTGQNLTATPMYVSTANGFGLGGSADLTCMVNTNQAWGPLTASQTNYLFETNTNGACATGFTILAPIYQRGGTISVTAGQYTFDINAMQMYLGNGATAPAVNVTFVGEAVTGVGTVTSSVAYAYQGRYRSADTAIPGASTRTAFAHNIGVLEVELIWRLKNVTTEGNWTAGQLAAFLFEQGGSIETSVGGSEDRNTASLATGAAGTSVSNRTTGALVAITPAKWNFVLEARRTW